MQKDIVKEILSADKEILELAASVRSKKRSREILLSNLKDRI